MELQALLKLIQKVKENDLSKEYIIPLFEGLGYFKVEFFGGTNEEGKDILLWKKDILNEIELEVVQVKHFKFSNRASDEKSLQTIINQLIMCFEKKNIIQ